MYVSDGLPLPLEGRGFGPRHDVAGAPESNNNNNNNNNNSNNNNDNNDYYYYYY